jgi:hypothetical protein
MVPPFNLQLAIILIKNRNFFQKYKLQSFDEFFDSIWRDFMMANTLLDGMEEKCASLSNNPGRRHTVPESPQRRKLFFKHRFYRQLVRSERARHIFIFFFG